MAIFRRAEIPHPGMYVLDEDLALDGKKVRVVPAGSPAARFVLGVAGGEVSARVIDHLEGVEVADGHVRLKQERKAVVETETTGPVTARPAGETTVTTEAVTTEAVTTATANAEPETAPPDVEQAKALGDVTKPTPKTGRAEK